MRTYVYIAVDAGMLWKSLELTMSQGFLNHHHSVLIMIRIKTGWYRFDRLGLGWNCVQCLQENSQALLWAQFMGLRSDLWFTGGLIECVRDAGQKNEPATWRHHAHEKARLEFHSTDPVLHVFEFAPVKQYCLLQPIEYIPRSERKLAISMESRRQGALALI